MSKLKLSNKVKITGGGYVYTRVNQGISVHKTSENNNNSKNNSNKQSMSLSEAIKKYKK